MSLDLIWAKFLRDLREEFPEVEYRNSIGQPFITITSYSPKEQLNDQVIDIAGKAMRGKIVSADVRFVRMAGCFSYVYAIRFLVPLRKRFCCGNGCVDCIRLQP